MCVYSRETDGTVYRRVIAHLVPLCEIDSIQLKNTGAHFYRQGDIHVVSVCISEFPSVGYKSFHLFNTHTFTHLPTPHTTFLCMHMTL